MTILIPVLGDQLSHQLASLRDVDRAEAIVLMMEVAEETTYVRHHQRKIALTLSAMRHFAAELRADGWTVDYIHLDDQDNMGSFTGEVKRAVERHRPASIRIVEPGEWRVKVAIDGWAAQCGVPVDVLPDDRFICSTLEFQTWAQARNELTMEFFYRDMRRKTGLLMTADGKPEGGQWNLDKDNRASPKRGIDYPEPMSFVPDETTASVMKLVAARFSGHFGRLEKFGLPVTAAQAVRALDHFVRTALPDFGTYQDAMVTGQDWLFHSWLSPALNLGLLTPLQVATAAADAFAAGHAPLNSVEGFIRQIIGWREYVRGIYWWTGPEYGTRNFLNAKRALPAFYWTGETDMHCLSQAIGQTLDLAYAHHIQRLMVTGNFALLIGADPDDVDRWYLEVYADAYEWVEQPNTRGMVLFADGGLLGSKPYASSGAYIDRMSDYCGWCRYDVKQRTGPSACPFNALYWDFLARNEAKLGRNVRLAMPYRTWAKMDPATQDALRGQAASFLERLDAAPKGY